MQSLHKDILNHLRKKIIADLDVDNGITSLLKTEFILNDKDVERINAGRSKEERASILLDILPGCGRYSFNVFHQALKHHYEWLSDAIDEMLGNDRVEGNGVDYYAVLPSIPPVSPLSVTREEKITQLKDALQQLKPGEYITLHGMKGFGKSSLAALTLKDMKLVTNLFGCEVYWLKFICERPIDEEILIQLNTLYHYVKNLEIQLETFTPLEKDSLIRFLGHYFSRAKHQNALLILDDVFDKKIIKAFDFECKTLVLTSDTDVLDGRISKKTIWMNDGFTEMETLGLFAQVLDMPIDRLPSEAKQIHRECKGMPLLIAMFAAQFEEFKKDLRITDGTRDRWKYYLNSLRKKDPKNKVIKEFLEKQETIFDMCIDQLRADLKEQYKMLAIFNEDVNITRKTLDIMWDQDVFHVEESMLDLCHKSLAAKQWHEDSKSYIYGVHDLLLCHLRKRLKPEELTQLHRSVVNKYRNRCNNDFSKLENDNYIHSYIGYHLEQAKLYNEFQTLYLNFDFIQAKIIHSGLSDLLLDLKKYREYITRENIDYETRVSDLEEFLQEQVSIIVEQKRKKCLDIVQIAMNHSREGYITQNARYLAEKRQKYLYLSHDKKPAYDNMTLSVEVSSGICTSSFTDNPDLILTGDTSGKVILWDCENKVQTVYNSNSNGYSVKKIVVSAKGDNFLTLTDNGVVKLFYLDDKQDHSYTHVGSPKEKQKDWTRLFTNDSKQDDSLLDLSIKNEIILDMAFGHDDKFIATCTDKGIIQIWNRDGKIVLLIDRTKGDSITKIAFTDQYTLLHVMNETKGSLYVYSRNANNHSLYEYAACYNLQLQERNVIYFHNVPIHDNSLMIVTTKRALYVKWMNKLAVISNFKKQERAYVENNLVNYVCAAITHNGKYLVVADSGGFVNVWHTDVGYQPDVKTYKNSVTSLDTYWLKEDDHLICGNENNLLHRLKLPGEQILNCQEDESESSKLVRKSLFDAIVKPYNETDIIVKESYKNHIVVLHGETQVAHFTYNVPEGKLSNLKLFPNQNKVLYVMEQNSVPYRHKLMLFDVNTKTTLAIMESASYPLEFTILNINGCDMVICRETENSLKVWQNKNGKIGAYIVSNTGRVAFIHKYINDDHVMMITQKGVIKIWRIENCNWQQISEINIDSSSNTNISFSCLSHMKTYLAVLKESGKELIVLTFSDDTTYVPTIKKKNEHLERTFGQKITYCDISQDEQYIAVGFETGCISIIDLTTEQKMEIQQLRFHNNPIKQLSWGPTALEAPILLSLADDELAWWNVSLQNDNTNTKKRRTRMGIGRSTSLFVANTSPTQKMPNSQSLDAGMSRLNAGSSAGTANGTNHMRIQWKNKVGKDPEMPALLAAVELPQCRAAKVCISPDFTKFVTVDIYGSVSTFKPFNNDT